MNIATMPMSSGPTNVTEKMLEYQNAMRQLWQAHIAWARLYLVSATERFRDMTATIDRLMQNQVDIGDAIKPYYGRAAGEKLTTLLKEHIAAAGELAAALQAKDEAKADRARKRWYANADSIAAFLSRANPKQWPKSDLERMMHEHLRLTTAEVLTHLQGDWRADVEAYGRTEQQILHMADTLSEGIIAQHASKF